MKAPALLALLLTLTPIPAVAEPGGALRIDGIDHVGVNVPDADAAIAFFHELIGTRVVSDVRPPAVSAEWKRRFRWHPTTAIQRLVMLEAQDGSRIELFQYAAPAANRVQPHEDDAGATHIALKAHDPARSLEVIRRHHLRVLNDPVPSPEGSLWFYFLTPWGSRLTLKSRCAMWHTRLRPLRRQVILSAGALPRRPSTLGEHQGLLPFRSRTTIMLPV